MTTATLAPPRLADYFTMPAKRCLAYAEMLVRDIPAGTFAHMPHPTMNHPAFAIGHLSLYPNRLCTMLGRTDLIVDRKGFEDLFKAGAACVENDGRYPPKDEITAYFFERYNAIISFVASQPDEVFARENPMEGRYREIFPFVGLAVNFMLNNHVMSHLGQVSAWRRAVGLPSVM